MAVFSPIKGGGKKGALAQLPQRGKKGKMHLSFFLGPQEREKDFVTAIPLQRGGKGKPSSLRVWSRFDRSL